MDRDDEQMRALLAEVGHQQGPPLGFNADGIARRSRRIQFARWGAGVAGSLVVAAVITLSVALATNRSVPPATPPPATITTTDTPEATGTPTSSATTTDTPTTTTTTTMATPTTTT
jgi:hypothetical protein